MALCFICVCTFAFSFAVMPRVDSGQNLLHRNQHDPACVIPCFRSGQRCTLGNWPNSGERTRKRSILMTSGRLREVLWQRVDGDIAVWLRRKNAFRSGRPDVTQPPWRSCLPYRCDERCRLRRKGLHPVPAFGRPHRHLANAGPSTQMRDCGEPPVVNRSLCKGDRAQMASGGRRLLARPRVHAISRMSPPTELMPWDAMEASMDSKIVRFRASQRAGPAGTSGRCVSGTEWPSKSPGTATNLQGLRQGSCPVG